MGVRANFQNKISSKHLDRFVLEFAGRQDMRELDTIDQLRLLRSGTDGKQLI